MQHFSLFGTGFLLSLSLCLDIGVVNVALINTAIRNGVRAAALFALGSCVGDLIYAIASLLGIDLLLQYAAVRLALYATGTAILLVMCALAVRAALRSIEQPEDPVAVTGAVSRRLFFYGLGITLASPSAIIWFAAVGGSLIAQSGAHTMADLFALLAGFFCAGVAWCLFIITVAAYGGRAFGVRFRQVCHWISAALFLFFAAKVAGALLAMF